MRQLVLVGLGWRPRWRWPGPGPGARCRGTRTGLPFGRQRVAGARCRPAWPPRRCRPPGTASMHLGSLPREVNRAVEPLVGAGARVVRAWSSGLTVPDSTLNSEIWPTYGSAIVLNTKASGCAARASAATSMSVVAGDHGDGAVSGRRADLADEVGQPVDGDGPVAEPHTTGKTVAVGHARSPGCARAPRRAARRPRGSARAARRRPRRCPRRGCRGPGARAPPSRRGSRPRSPLPAS